MCPKHCFNMVRFYAYAHDVMKCGILCQDNNSLISVLFFFFSDIMALFSLHVLSCLFLCSCLSVFCLFYFPSFSFPNIPSPSSSHTIILCLSFPTSFSTPFLSSSTTISSLSVISVSLLFFLLCLPASPSSNTSSSLTCYSIALSSSPSSCLSLKFLFTKILFVIGWICTFGENTPFLFTAS